MKNVFWLYLTLLLSLPLASKAEELFHASSKERGITVFDFEVMETERNEHFSNLEIPNFQSRSAQASRWMMCIYTELAISRNAKYWTSIYTDNSGDKVTVVLPKTYSTNDPAFKGVDTLGISLVVMPVSKMKAFCGLK